MGRARTKAEKYWANILWKRRQFKKCPRRKRLDQEPLPPTEVGDYIMVWDEEAAGFYGGPCSIRLWHCGCTAGNNRQHGIVKHFLRVISTKGVFARVAPVDDPANEFDIYQPSIIFNVGKISPLDPRQDFAMLVPAQKRFIIRTFTAKDKVT